MRVVVANDADEAAERAADELARMLSAAVASRGRAVVALSGGATPWRMLEALRERVVPWRDLHVVQVDERVVSAGSAQRTFPRIRDALAPVLAADRLHPMPADDLTPDDAARAYATTLSALAGDPPVLDVVHLGLGADGHTASLVLGDSVLDIVDADVAATARPFDGARRLTLTFPALARARAVLWLVSGSEKRDALARLLAHDPTTPAARVPPERAVLVTDVAAHPAGR